MTTYKKIMQVSKDTKKSVETKHKLPVNPRWAYPLSKAVLTPGKEVKTLHNIQPAKAATGDEFKANIPIADIKKWIKQFIKYVDKNNRLPSSMIWNNKKIHPKVYCYMFAWINVYYQTNKKYPAKVPVDTSLFINCNSPYISQPHFLNQGSGYLGQINPYNCGPHSARQALKKLGVVVSESQLAEWAGTTIYGTDHQGIRTAIAMAAKRAGVNITVEEKNFNELGWKGLGELICKPNVAAFLHIDYSGAGEYYDPDDDCGHYEMLDRINTGTKYCRALNSLGSRDGYGYYGHLQERTFSLQEKYISRISQKSVFIIKKN